MNSIHQNIADKIERITAGSLVFPADFRGLGSEDAIKMSLSRHAAQGSLARLGHGIYLKAGKKGKQPAPEAIAAAIAKKEGVRIRPDGVSALYQLGMTKIKPDELTFLTDGEPRSIKIGDQRLIFKSTTCKKLSLSNTTSGLLVLALEEIGKDKITDELTKQVAVKLAGLDEKTWSKDLQLAPGWIYNLLFKLHQKSAI